MTHSVGKRPRNDAHTRLAGGINAALGTMDPGDTWAIHAAVDMVGPPLAGVLVGFAGSIAAFVAIAICYATATICVGQVRGAVPRPPPTGQFLGQALEGLQLTVFSDPHVSVQGVGARSVPGGYAFTAQGRLRG